MIKRITLCHSTQVLAFLVFMLFPAKSSFAQYVTVKDSVFAEYIKVFFPGCISGRQLDTTCPDVINAKLVFMTNYEVSNIEEIRYFKSAERLLLGSFFLTNVPPLPKTLTHLTIMRGAFSKLPELPPRLQYLLCERSQLTELPKLPDSLITLGVEYNKLSSLPVLPSSLKGLSINSNNFDKLPPLPEGLEDLMFRSNKIDTIPELPKNLKNIYMDFNLVRHLPALPDSLITLRCAFNRLNSMPALPSKLKELYCQNNQISDAFPALPDSMRILYCGSNLISSLPELPASMERLNCSDNNIKCFPIFPYKALEIGVENNPFTCLPNHVPGMRESLLKVPVCEENDTVNNPGSCPVAKSVEGYVYADTNNNCMRDAGEPGIPGYPMTLRDSNGNLVHKLTTNTDGAYRFSYFSGKYTISVDTTGLPFNLPCPGGPDSTIIMESLKTVTGVDFATTCKSGHDLGVQSITARGAVFPGRVHYIFANVGDLARMFGFDCVNGISGSVNISVSGKLTYKGPAYGALQPATVNKNDFTYTIMDFGKLKSATDFGLAFMTDTNATESDSICIFVSVVSNAGDRNQHNNTSKFCYRVTNSFDPNMKEVYPVNVPENFHDNLVYTIHFQNTGNAPAHNIRLADTLDAQLDPETFRVLESSHAMQASLKGHILSFRFNDIMLPDSHSNSQGSHGFVQYSVKPLLPWTTNTRIYNTAYIYFDYNTPVVTNTTANAYLQPQSGIASPAFRTMISTYPNPSQGKVMVRSTAGFDLQVRDITGKCVGQLHHSGELVLPSGVFFFEYTTGYGKWVEKVVVF